MRHHLPAIGPPWRFTRGPGASTRAAGRGRGVVCPRPSCSSIFLRAPVRGVTDAARARAPPAARSRLVECAVCGRSVHAALAQAHVNECPDAAEAAGGAEEHAA